MSNPAIKWAWAQKVGGHIDRLVLLALADHANPTTHQCWPSQQSLARQAMCSTDSVQRACKRLEASGLITRAKRGDKVGGRASDLYTLLVSDTAELSRTERLKVKPLPAAEGEGVKPQIAGGLSRTAMRQEPKQTQSKELPMVVVEGQTAEPLPNATPALRRLMARQEASNGNKVDGFTYYPSAIAFGQRCGLSDAELDELKRECRTGGNPNGLLKHRITKLASTRLTLPPDVVKLANSRDVAERAAAIAAITAAQLNISPTRKPPKRNGAHP